VPRAASATPPNVTILRPGNGSRFTAPAAFTIYATATDDGVVAKVEFFANGVSLGSPVTVAPYILAVRNLGEGEYAIKAVGTDNEGTQGTSPTVNVTVAPSNRPPTISVTSPLDGAVFRAPTTVVFEAIASDADGPSPAVTVNIGSARYGNRYLVKTPPYRLQLTDLPAGKYVITAWAFDSEVRTEAPSLNITVVEPVRLSDPKTLADGRFEFTISGAVGLEYVVEAATQPGGPWTRVETLKFAAPTQAFNSGASGAGSRFFRVVTQ